MKHQVNYRSNWILAMAILLIFAVVGCSGQVAAPTLPPESSPIAETASPPTEAATSPTEPSVKQTATSEPSPGNVFYQDDFTNPGTGWAAAEFGSYFIGYHEPESYHVEIQAPHLAAPVISIPKAPNYPDATIELAVQTVAGKTSTEGDYRYGIAFRQSGDNYYAFTISPTNKTWQVFKHSPGSLTPLKDGTEESIQGLDVDDVLRVDMQGSNFFFYINDNLVDQVTDSDYLDGMVGLYAENLENVKTHIHFGNLTITELNLSFTCSVPAGENVYVRRGPGQNYAQIGLLSGGQTVKALGISPNEWIQIIVEGNSEPLWVSYNYEGGQLSCTPGIDSFPVVNP